MHNLGSNEIVFAEVLLQYHVRRLQYKHYRVVMQVHPSLLTERASSLSAQPEQESGVTRTAGLASESHGFSFQPEVEPSEPISKTCSHFNEELCERTVFQRNGIDIELLS